MEKWFPLTARDEVVHQDRTLIVRWASPSAIEPEQKAQAAVELGRQLPKFGFTPPEIGVRQSHELAHSSAANKPSQLLVLEDSTSGKIITGTTFLEELTREEELAVLEAPNDPQVDDLIQTAEIKTLLE